MVSYRGKFGRYAHMGIFLGRGALLVCRSFLMLHFLKTWGENFTCTTDSEEVCTVGALGARGDAVGMPAAGTCRRRGASRAWQHAGTLHDMRHNSYPVNPPGGRLRPPPWVRMHAQRASIAE